VEYSTNSKVPVLIIEDQTEHYLAIAGVLDVQEYELDRLNGLDHNSLLNYKALKQDNQIVIVDLHLQASKYEGIDLIKRWLWPSDRTAFFVVFSQFIDKSVQPRFDEVQPHWTFVAKEFDAGTRHLTSECLSRLRNVVGKYRGMCIPPLRMPMHSTRLLLAEQEHFLREAANQPHRSGIEKVSWPAVARSVDILNEASRACINYGKAGGAAASIGIGIYGSCGRLEARENSDIEFSVYFDGEDPGGVKELAVSFWNRLDKSLRSRGWTVEGTEAIQIQSPPLLHLDDVTDDLQNRYLRVIPIRALLAGRLQQQPQLRDRHLQILTEMRPVFNPAFLVFLKRQLIVKGMGAGVPNVTDIIGHPYFSEMLTQYFVDTRPEELTQFRDYKKFCYRLLNLLALRVSFVELVSRDSQFLNTDDDWDQFFDVIATPGLYKLTRFSTACRHELALGKYNSKLQKSLFPVIGSYIDTLERLEQMARGLSANRRSGDDWTSELRQPTRQCTEKFVRLFEDIASVPYFRRVQDNNWLLRVDDVRSLVGRL
jgi:hypothetical protein